jgi:hypothetical protein
VKERFPGRCTQTPDPVGARDSYTNSIEEEVLYLLGGEEWQATEAFEQKRNTNKDVLPIDHVNVLRSEIEMRNALVTEGFETTY